MDANIRSPPALRELYRTVHEDNGIFSPNLCADIAEARYSSFTVWRDVMMDRCLDEWMKCDLPDQLRGKMILLKETVHLAKGTAGYWISAPK